MECVAQYLPYAPVGASMPRRPSPCAARHAMQSMVHTGTGIDTRIKISTGSMLILHFPFCRIRRAARRPPRRAPAAARRATGAVQSTEIPHHMIDAVSCTSIRIVGIPYRCCMAIRFACVTLRCKLFLREFDIQTVEYSNRCGLRCNRVKY